MEGIQQGKRDQARSFTLVMLMLENDLAKVISE